MQALCGDKKNELKALVKDLILRGFFISENSEFSILPRISQNSKNLGEK